MLSYEICKKLKEAGFPQSIRKGYYYANGEEELACDGIGYICDCFSIFDVKNPYRREIILIPTLSELIEACGNGLEQIWNVSKDDCADKHKWEAHTDEYCMVGSTPEEAVSLLYLELNKKK